jgi:glutamate-1-semialdehyde 2,1-aminomutase
MQINDIQKAESAVAPLNCTRSLALQDRFRKLIPGGAHTYAKGDDQFPEFMPVYIARGKGCHVWDEDGNDFIEYGSGLRAVTLGHAFEPVVEAAQRQLQWGSNFVRPTRLELECAEALQSMIPCAEMLKFGKHGSDAVNAAVKLARAFTGRDSVAICGDHPFFSVDDWFIGTSPMPAGVPRAVSDLTVKFRYNDLADVEGLFERMPSQIAAVVLEAERDKLPAADYLPQLKELCTRRGAVLVFDEMITGFRWHNGGAQAFHGVTPDLAAFGKGIANGFSVSALAGRRDIMQLGGFDHDQERVFLLSTTHGAETHALAAALATMQTYRDQPVVETLWRQGRRLAEGVRRVVRDVGVEEHFKLAGRECCLLYATLDADRQPSQAFRTLFLQETMKRGVLAPSFVVNYSHGDAEIDQTVFAISEALEVYRRALEDGVEKYLVGRPVKPVFRRFS